MRICLVLEGSYPYVHGGVSTWMHQYITEMREHEFVLWIIGANQEQSGKYVYDLPDNVIEVQEVFLDQVVERVGPTVPIHLSDREQEAIRQLVFCDQPDWSVLFDLFQTGKISPIEFLSSKEFFIAIQDLCANEFGQFSMANVFHTIRSILFPLLNLLSSPIPKADLYHSISTGYGGILATMGSDRHSTPLILTEHGIYTREREEELLRAQWVLPTMRGLWIRFFYLLSDAIYQRADKVTSLFTNAKNIQIEMGCSQERCVVIPNGIDYEKFTKLPLKSENGWVDIGAVVRLAPIKDIKTMLYAFYELALQRPNVRLHILGGVDDPDYAQECYQLAEKMQLGDRLIFAGRVMVQEYLKQIDFTLLTSLSEGLPLSVLESMAARRPCVTTDVGCCRELLEGKCDDDLGRAGLCVPPTAVNELVEAMKQLVDQENLRIKMGQVAAERVAHTYRFSQMIHQYRSLYKGVVG